MKYQDFLNLKKKTGIIQKDNFHYNCELILFFQFGQFKPIDFVSL